MNYTNYFNVVHVPLIFVYYLDYFLVSKRVCASMLVGILYADLNEPKMVPSVGPIP